MGMGELNEHLRSLRTLSEEPFVIEAYESACQRFGWTTTRERFTGYGSGFDCYGPPGPPIFTACFDEGEQCAALGILAVGESIEDPIFRVDTKDALDEAFNEANKLAVEILGRAEESGRYSCEGSPESYPFAYWRYANAYLVLLEFPETDYSNDPSLDVRLVPIGKRARLQLPLQSNLPTF